MYGAEMNAPPVMMRLSLHTQRNVTQRKRVSVQVSREKNTLSTICGYEKSLISFAVTSWLLKQRNTTTVPLQNENKNERAHWEQAWMIAAVEAGVAMAFSDPESTTLNPIHKSCGIAQYS